MMSAPFRMTNGRMEGARVCEFVSTKD